MAHKGLSILGQRCLCQFENENSYVRSPRRCVRNVSLFVAEVIQSTSVQQKVWCWLLRCGARVVLGNGDKPRQSFSYQGDTVVAGGPCWDA